MKQTKQIEWEELFYSKWSLWNKDEYGSFTTCGEEVKSFIRSLLAQRDKELIEKIENLKRTYNNLALNEVIKLIKQS